MKTKKHDFVELDFTGKANGVIFDTTNKEESKKMGIEKEVKPLIVSVGAEMVLKGFDKALEDKEIDKDYSVMLKPEDAFGKRNASLIKTLPLGSFSEMPRIGMFVNVNNMIARVISINSGRVLLDFNNPLAGKDLVYEFKINRFVTDIKEKIKSLADYYGLEVDNIEIKENKAECSAKSTKDKDIKNKFKKKVRDLLHLDCDFI